MVKCQGGVIKRIWLVLIILSLISAFYLSGAYQHFSLENIQHHLKDLKEFKQQQPVYFFTLYFGIYFLLTALSIPGTIVLTLLSGAIFGVIPGTIFAVCASTLGASMSFLTSRYLFRDYIRHKYSRRFHKFNSAFEEKGLSYLFTLRLIPVSPFVFINLMMGLTTIRLFTFIWVTFVGMLPGTFVYVLAGKEISKINEPSDILTWPIILSLTLIGLLPFVIKKVLSRVRGSGENYGY